VPWSNFDVASAYDSNSSNTVFTVTLASNVEPNSVLDVTVHPTVPSAATYFQSGYLYHHHHNYIIP
jgi:hypothetical protein